MAVGTRDSLMDLSLAKEDRQATGACGGCHARFELRTFADLGELERLWLDLEQRTSAPLFLSWDWIGCWIREALLQPVVVIGRAEGAVVLLGIVTSSARRGWLPVTRRDAPAPTPYAAMAAVAAARTAGCWVRLR